MAVNDEIIVADLGGTHARFALGRREKGTITLSKIRQFKVRDYSSVDEVAAEFLRGADAKPAIGCFAMAGPVLDETVKFTNSPWVLGSAEIKRALGLASFKVVNDFEALASGVRLLTDDDFEIIKSGHGDPEKPTLIIGPGTGLGQAISVKRKIIATEGGHVLFAPIGAAQKAVIEKLEMRFHRVSVERLLSGNGLVEIYCALSGVDIGLWSGEAVTAAARSGGDQFAVEAVSMFCEMLGQAVGDAVLATGALGGVILAGGILPQMRELLNESAFVERFNDKAEMSKYMSSIPVRLIIRDNVALLGAADMVVGHARLGAS
ncbi:glucokinase [Hyphococcus lacteus]|uniref:Glucokinase n=1 Tax=Hyphococcus lacteus TaxID=3143536 RepID=A0ABV3ZBJ7_9PROT